jgi:rhodanese-related sulfurtransferase
MQDAHRAVAKALMMGCLAGGVAILAGFSLRESDPWVYAASREIVLAGVKIPLIDTRRARNYFGDGITVFVDARRADDYEAGHVKGALFLPPHQLEQRFPSVEPRLPRSHRLIVYCYSPKCDMAERVALFLAQIGYRKLMIMESGYSAWERAGYPIEDSYQCAF